MLGVLFGVSCSARAAHWDPGAVARGYRDLAADVGRNEGSGKAEDGRVEFIQQAPKTVIFPLLDQRDM